MRTNDNRGIKAAMEVQNEQEWECPECSGTTGKPVSFDYGIDPDNGYHDKGEGCTECHPGGSPK